VDRARVEALIGMTPRQKSHQPSSAHDELVQKLLDCGGVLSQIVSHMVESEWSGRSAPDAAPIPEVAHELVRSVTTDLMRRHTEQEIRVAAVIVGEVEEAICNDIFFVPVETH
jgi:hypothetical protein